MKIFIILILFLLNTPNCLSQALIWSEDFESYTNGTQNAIKWTTSAGNCDADGIPGISGNNYWGVRTTLGDKEFCCEDIEGITCCVNSQGQSDNIWLSESINISSYSNISIQLSMRAEGNMECSNCGQGNDLFLAQYQVDGGVWVSFLSICGVSNGYANIGCVDVSNGSTLKIRVLLGNQADDEEYYFDDIYVYESTCSIILPVELINFDGLLLEDINAVRLDWSTASESNNDRFDIYKSLDGFEWVLFASEKGVGNSTIQNNYSIIDYEVPLGVSYYRLDQIDFDGHSSIKKIVSIDNKIDSEDVFYLDFLGRKYNDINNKNGLFIKVTQKNNFFNTETLLK